METRLLTAAFVRLWLATLGAFATFGMVVLALPLYVKDQLDYGSVGVGLAMGAASVTSVIFSVVSGRLGDRYGRRPLLVVGGVVMLGGYLALALEPALVGVVSIRIVAGAAEATFVVAVYTAVMDISPEERRGEAVSLVTLASYLGLTFGPVLADFVRGSDRYPLVWLVTAALVFAATAVVATLHETKPVTEEPSVGSWLPPRGALRPGLLVLLGLLGFGGFVAFGAIYARDLGIDRPGLIFALFGGVISLVRFFGRRLPDALGPTRTLELSFICLAGGLAMVGGWQTTTGLLVGTVVFAVGQAMTYPSAVLLAVQSTSSAERSAVVGSVGAAVDVALGLGALTLGGVAKFWGYGGAFLVASAVALSGLAALWPLRGVARQTAAKLAVEDRDLARPR
jgi:MFS family permease